MTNPAEFDNRETTQLTNDVQNHRFSEAQKLVSEKMLLDGQASPVYAQAIKSFNDQHIALPAEFGAAGELQILNGTLEAVGPDGKRLDNSLAVKLHNGDNSPNTMPDWLVNSGDAPIAAAFKNNQPVDIIVSTDVQRITARADIDSALNQHGGRGDAQIVVSNDESIKTGDIRENGRMAIVYGR